MLNRVSDCIQSTSKKWEQRIERIADYIQLTLSRHKLASIEGRKRHQPAEHIAEQQLEPRRLRAQVGELERLDRKDN